MTVSGYSVQADELAPQRMERLSPAEIGVGRSSIFDIP